MANHIATVWDEMRSDLNELISLVRASEQYHATVEFRTMTPDSNALQQDLDRSARIVALSTIYGLRA